MSDTLFTRGRRRPLTESMDTYEGLSERAYFDYLEARERALEAAAGVFSVGNVPTAHLRIIAETTSNELIILAARVVLHQRGELEETPHE